MLKVSFRDKFKGSEYIVDGDTIRVGNAQFGFTGLMHLKLAKWLKEWMENGYAISSYGGRYKHAERRARRARTGIWDDKISFHPGEWRKKSTNVRIL